MKKYDNEDYTEEKCICKKPVNKNNKTYIDEWVKLSYPQLFCRFYRCESAPNKDGYTNIDILHESMVRIYTDRSIMFKSGKEAFDYLNAYFHLGNKK